MITSADLARWGKATFDGLLVDTDFARDNLDFMCRFLLTVAASDEAYRSDPEAFGATSANAKTIAELVGGVAEDVPDELARYQFPTLQQQASPLWLGGGAAQSLKVISRFLKEQGILDEVREDYSDVVTLNHVSQVLAGC